MDVFKQCNAAFPAFTLIQECVLKERVDVLKFPSQGVVLNPMEKVWGKLQRTV